MARNESIIRFQITSIPSSQPKPNEAIPREAWDWQQPFSFTGKIWNCPFLSISPTHQGKAVWDLSWVSVCYQIQNTVFCVCTQSYQILLVLNIIFMGNQDVLVRIQLVGNFSVFALFSQLAMTIDLIRKFWCTARIELFLVPCACKLLSLSLSLSLFFLQAVPIHGFNSIRPLYNLPICQLHLNSYKIMR